MQHNPAKPCRNLQKIVVSSRLMRIMDISLYIAHKKIRVYVREEEDDDDDEIDEIMRNIKYIFTYVTQP